MRTIPTIVKKLKKLVNEESFRERYAEKATDFTRQREIGIVDIVYFILGSVKTSLPFEIMNWSKQSGKKIVSRSAITQSRRKIKSEAFEYLLSEANGMLIQDKKYHQYSVIAVDGMTGELPKTKELMEKYTPSKGSGYPQFKGIAMYDVLNNYFLDSLFMPFRTDERATAKTLIQKMGTEEKQILLFDRGFPSVSLIKELNEANKYFVMRASSSFLKEVNDFGKTKAVDKQLHICYDRRRGQLSGVKGIELPYEFDLRCVRIELRNKQTEILITNLPRENFKRYNLKELYKMRWGIEVSFNHLKNAIFVEEFIGKTENSIKQEYFASLLVYNLCMCFVYDTEVTRAIKKNSKTTL